MVCLLGGFRPPWGGGAKPHLHTLRQPWRRLPLRLYALAIYLTSHLQGLRPSRITLQMRSASPVPVWIQCASCHTHVFLVYVKLKGWVEAPISESVDVLKVSSIISRSHAVELWVSRMTDASIVEGNLKPSTSRRAPMPMLFGNRREISAVA